MRVLLLVPLTACAPEHLDPGVDPAHDLSALLTEEAEDLPERTRSLDGAVGALTPGGEPLSGEPWPGEHTWVVGDATADEVAIVWTSHVLQVGVWLDRDGLDRVPAQHTWAGGTGDGAPGVRLSPGTSLEVVEEAGGRARVRASCDWLEVDAWVPASDVDEVWAADLPAPDFDAGDGDFVRVLAGVELLDAPAGDVIAWTTEEQPQTGRVVDAARGHARVRWMAGSWPVDVWVHEDDLEPSLFGIGTSGWGCGCSGGWGMRGPPNVRAEAWLRVEPAGAVVGRVRRDAWLGLGGDPGDWRSTEVETPFGAAVLWVDPADVL